MTTVVAATPASTAAHLPPGPSTEAMSVSTGARSYAAIAPSPRSAASSSPASSNGGASRHAVARASVSNHAEPSVVELGSKPTPDSGKRSPNSIRNAPPPIIKVKKEPSPEPPTPRHRPHRLDLSRSMANREHGERPTIPGGARTALTTKAGGHINDLSIACLSPGFHTQDSAMQHQLERSISIREQQRQLIEARNKGGKGSNNQEKVPDTANPFSASKPPGSSRRKGPPPALTINAPSHSAFANERVIQSAPLNQTFTGLRQPGPSGSIQHIPARQTNNRLPPIADVFAADNLPQPPRTSNPLGQTRSHHNSSPGSNGHAPLPSPGFPPGGPTPGTANGPLTSRPREYKSAEEAVHSLAAERGDMLPRIVHYGGHQPPTPPSPLPTSNPHSNQRSVPSHLSQHSQTANQQPQQSFQPPGSGSGRRRMRDEYERDNGSPPLGTSRYERRSGPFGEGRDSPDTQRRKKEEFMSLCARAWDLFHS